MSYIFKPGTVYGKIDGQLTDFNLLVGDTKEDLDLIKQKAQEALDSIPEDYTDLNNEVSQLSESIDEIKKSNGMVLEPEYTETSGYFDYIGNISPAGSDTKEVYTNKLKVNPKENIKWSVSTNVTTLLWVSCMYYDADEKAVGTRHTLQDGTQQVRSCSGEFIVPENVASIAFSYRTYGGKNMLWVARTYSLDKVSEANHNIDELFASQRNLDENSDELKKRLSEVENLSEPSFNLKTTWELGTLVKGNIETYVRYRVCSKDIITADRDIDFSVSDGFRIAFHTFVNGAYSSDLGWHTGKYSISKGVSFKCMIARTVDNSSEVADINEYVSKITTPTKLYSMVERLDDIDKLESELENDSALNMAELVMGKYIRYSDGMPIGSGGYFRYYQFVNPTFKHIKAFVYSADTVPCAISFYSDTTISNSSYMKDKSIQFEGGSTNGKMYEADVPDGCKLIAITTRTDAAGANPKAYITLKNVIDLLANDVDSLHEIEWSKLKNYKGEGYWIRHANGEKNLSTATTSWEFINYGMSSIRAFLASDTPVINAVSAYDAEGNYLADESIAWAGSFLTGNWYEFDVRPNWYRFVVTTRKFTENGGPVILFKTNEISALINNVFDGNTIDDIQNELQARNNEPLLSNSKYIYHYGMSAVGERYGTPVIPSQSIFDIRNAVKLGYKIIEANLHKTSDGHYVVTHGQDGALGHDFNDLNGNDAYGVKIASTSLETLRNNYRYHSSIPEYRVPITTLEEFLTECSIHKITVMLQYVDDISMNMAIGRLGKNIIMYNAPRSKFAGTILEYLSLTSKTDIVSHCESIGRPYIYSMGNFSRFSDDELVEISNELHKRGFYLATAYAGNPNIKRLSGLGFDLFAHSMEAKKVIGENHTVIDGKLLSFNDDGTVSWEELNYFD